MKDEKKEKDAAKESNRKYHKIRSEYRTDDELNSFLRGLAKEGLDLDAHFTASCMHGFRAAVGGPAAVAHMIASMLRTSGGGRLDFSGELGGSRHDWPAPLRALRAVFEAAGDGAF